MRSSLLPGDPAFVAGYQLRARLGTGGMGQVFLSFTPGGRPIAIKVVRPEYAGDQEFRRRFRREIAAAQLVQGLYTAAVLDGDSDAPVPWLATAYVPGPSLQWAVSEHGPLPLPAVFRLMAGVAEALSAIHAAGLVHRDLKPANVLLAEDGPRVIDFGIAHAAESTSATRTGVLVGTPMFMAPEQISGDPVTPATDVFALGQLLVFAVTGHAAFGEGNRDALFFRILEREPNLDGCPDELRDIVARCLAKNGADRPTVTELIGLAGERSPGFQDTTVSWLPEPVATSLRDYEPPTWTPPPATGTTAGPVPPPSTTPWWPGGQAAPSPPSRPTFRGMVLILSAVAAALVLVLLLVLSRIGDPASVRADRTPSSSVAVVEPPESERPSVTPSAAPSAPPDPLYKNQRFTMSGGSCVPFATFEHGVLLTDDGPVVQTDTDGKDYDLYYGCSGMDTRLSKDTRNEFATTTGDLTFDGCTRALTRTPLRSLDPDDLQRGDRFCLRSIGGTLVAGIEVTGITGGDGTYEPDLNFKATAWPLQ